MKVSPSLASLAAFLLIGWAMGMTMRTDLVKSAAVSVGDATKRIAEIHAAEQRELGQVQQRAQYVEREIERLRQLVAQQKARDQSGAVTAPPPPRPSTEDGRSSVKAPSSGLVPGPKPGGMADYLK